MKTKQNETYQINESSDLKKLIKSEKKHNLFSWLSPRSEYWWKTILKLTFELIVITWVVFTLTFILFNIVPGEPALISSAKQKGDPVTIAALEDMFKVGDNYGFFERYFYALKGFFDGTLGYSWTTGEEISTIFWARLWISFQIGMIALAIAAIIGIPLGVFLARRKNTSSDIITAVASIIAYTIPSFAIALVIVGINSLLGLPSVFEFGNIFIYLIAGIIIAIPTAASYSRYLRSSIRNEYNEQYVSLARIKGVSENKILWKHIFKPALFPIINFLPLMVISVLFGSITVETVFGIPGTGQMLIDAAVEHDQSILLVVTVFYTMFVVVSFFIRDLLIKFVDPRIKGI